MISTVSVSSKETGNNFISISSIYLAYELRYSIVFFFGLPYLISSEHIPIVQLAVKAQWNILYESFFSFRLSFLIELQN